MGQLALGKFVFLGDPWVLQDLLSCEALVGIHMQHLGYQVLGTQPARGLVIGSAGEQTVVSHWREMGKASISHHLLLPKPSQ